MRSRFVLIEHRTCIDAQRNLSMFLASLPSNGALSGVQARYAKKHKIETKSKCISDSMEGNSINWMSYSLNNKQWTFYYHTKESQCAITQEHRLRGVCNSLSQYKIEQVHQKQNIINSARTSECSIKASHMFIGHGRSCCVERHDLNAMLKCFVNKDALSILLTYYDRYS